MRKYKNVPKIRFEEFNEEWSKEQLRKLVDIFDGTHQTPKYTKNGVKFVSVENIKSLETDKYISIDDFIKEYSSKRPQKGDVLMTRIGDIGTTNIVKSDEALGYYVTLALLKPKNIDGIYLSYSINSKSVQKDLWRRTLHIAFPKKINLGEIEKIEIKFPDLEEQIMIGNYFENLDNLISLQKQKYEKLLDLKKSMLYKLFPKEGETTPEIRFDGFNGNWQKKKLGDCFSERAESYPEGELLSVTINQGIKKFSDLDRKNNSNENKSKYKKVYVGDIAYNSMRMWQGASGYSPYEGIVSPAYTVFNPNEGIDSKCFSYLFKRTDIIHMFQIYSKGITSDNWNLKYPDFKELEVYVSPDYNEQKAIGEYFSKLDKLIELNKDKLEKLKNIKSSLLNKMFV